jgi:hypothetical protein
MYHRLSTNTLAITAEDLSLTDRGTVPCLPTEIDRADWLIRVSTTWSRNAADGDTVICMTAPKAPINHGENDGTTNGTVLVD